VRRGVLVMSAIPEVVPGVTYAKSGLRQWVDNLRHVENLPQRGPIVLAALLIVAAGLGLGDLILRGLRVRSSLSWPEKISLTFGIGMIGLSLGTLILGRCGLLHPWIVRGVLLVLAGNAGRFASGTAPRQTEGRAGAVGLVLITAPFLILMALAAMLPTIDFDAMEYHLQGPKEYYLRGKIAFLPHNVYTSMPFGVEMLHLLGMLVLGDWWRGALVGQLLIMIHAPMAAAMVGMAASRLASPRAGWFAAVIYLTTPWIFRLAALPYVEGPMLYYHAALIWGCTVALHPSLVRHWAILGLLAGGAMSCKYPALISAVIPFGLMAMCTRSPKAVLGFALGVSVAIGPWLAKNIVDTGNPVYPLANKVFGGKPWSAARETKWQNVHGPRPPSWAALNDGLLDIAGRSDWQSALFIALGPLAFLRRESRKTAWILLSYVTYIFATWFLFTHRLDRFWLPVLPPLAILAGQGADWRRDRAWSIVLGLVTTVAIVTNFVYASTALTAFNEWTNSLVSLRTSVPKMLNKSLARLDTELPPGARPLLVGQAAVFHMNHEVVYNTVFDDEILETFARDRSAEDVRVSLIARGITHVYVEWPEIARHRKPGGYGYTDFIQPQVFARLVRAGVLEPMEPPGPDRELYRVVRGVGR
ncbi:MAG: hypothetical protein JWN86_4300, partial [Planctomycetota bacterium]|nr:hypothetical protein [Planctomycetota bacterium]